MATNVYTGAAETRIDSGTITVGGTIEVGDVFKVTLGGATVQISAATTVVATVGTQLYTALIADTAPPQFATLTFTDNGDGTIDWEGPNDGRPVSDFLSVATTEAGGGAADAQTISKTVTQVGTGPYDLTNVQNWDTGAIPTNGEDVIFGMTPFLPRYNMDGLSAVTLNNLTVVKTDTDGLVLGSKPYNVDDGYYEYVETHLVVNFLYLHIGYGEGRYTPGGYVKGDYATTGSCLIRMYSSGNRDNNGNAPWHWYSDASTGSTNYVTVENGHLDIATLKPSYTPTLLSVSAGTKGNIRVGYDGNNGTVYEARNGGVLTLLDKWTSPAITVRSGGTVNMRGASLASVTTLLLTVERGGILNYERATTSIITTYVGYGRGNFTPGRSGTHTITNCDLYAGAAFVDGSKRLTFTNGIDLNGCTVADLEEFNIGQNIRLTRGTPA